MAHHALGAAAATLISPAALRATEDVRPTEFTPQQLVRATCQEVEEVCAVAVSSLQSCLRYSTPSSEDGDRSMACRMSSS